MEQYYQYLPYVQWGVFAAITVVTVTTFRGARRVSKVAVKRAGEIRELKRKVRDGIPREYVESLESSLVRKLDNQRDTIVSQDKHVADLLNRIHEVSCANEEQSESISLLRRDLASRDARIRDQAGTIAHYQEKQRMPSAELEAMKGKLAESENFATNLKTVYEKLKSDYLSALGSRADYHRDARVLNEKHEKELAEAKRKYEEKLDLCSDLARTLAKAYPDFDFGKWSCVHDHEIVSCSEIDKTGREFPVEHLSIALVQRR